MASAASTSSIDPAADAHIVAAASSRASSWALEPPQLLDIGGEGPKRLATRAPSAFPKTTFRLPAAGETRVIGQAMVVAIEVSGRDGRPSSVFFQVRPVS